MRFALILAVIALPAMAQDIDEGAESYMTHCAACHGVDARGDGPMATLLTVPPADLAALAQSNDGVFPAARVVQRIDGTTEILAHGGPMPIFGLLLQGPSTAMVAPDGSEVVAPEAIVNIAAWLEAHQR